MFSSCCFCFLLMIGFCGSRISSVVRGDSSNIDSQLSYHANYTETDSARVSPLLQQVFSPHRKLLIHGACTNRDISISQSRDSSSGIPQYIVQIVNTCISGCTPSNIHLHCGWFASARMVNPNTFKRLSYDDCIVNEGNPMKSSQMIRFTYSNSFMYPLQFKTAKFC